MNILTVSKLEDCIDGSTTYGYHFDGAWTREDVQHLRVMGTVEYYPEFPRPFFRVNGSGGLRIAGVMGDTFCEVTFPRFRKEAKQQEFERLFVRETAVA